MAVIIKEIPAKKSKLEKFVDFGINLYKGNEYYVPSLVLDELNTLVPSGNPAFEFCESKYFMAYDDVSGKPVGRIAGIINKVTNEKYNERHVRFGFVDFIDDKEVSRALIEAVEQWGREKGMDTIVGPLGFTDMDPEGMLIEGYDQLSTMATIYNYPYYPEHLEALGFEKEIDWIEFKMRVPEAVPEKMARIADIIRRKYNLSTPKYTSSKKLVKDYGEAIFKLINEAYDPLYGYSPLTNKQIKHYINMYLPILRLENVCLIAEESGELIGVGITLPSMSKALQKSRGRLFPFGWWHLLKALRGKNDIVDLMLVAIKPEYQSKGVNALLFADLIPEYIKNGYRFAESNPELEINQKVQSQWQYFDTEQHKRRRAYKKSL
ncbi:MAG: N-acetyltransferase [Muribaculaceae bacterium]|nr:N-acetyltransferase [Muribaculaceae bacterium]